MRRIGILAVLPLAALPSAAAAHDQRSAATGTHDTSAAAPDAAGPLTLACDGVVAHHAATGRSHRGAGAHGDATDGATGSADAPPVRFVFEFDGDRGRVQVPAALIPVVHSGGDGAGWWPVRDLVAGDDAFAGRIGLNLVNKPHFAIDRHTGRFDLSGGLDITVTGRCAKPSATPRLF